MGIDAPVDLEQELTELSLGRLQLRADIREANWHFWEKRNLNLHRVVALCTYASSTAQDVEIQTREAIGRHVRCAWWRGLGFGVVIEVREIADFPDGYQRLVDGRANSQGTWQWVIFVSRTRRRVWGLHTWIEGYLSDIYCGLLRRLEERGYGIASVRKEKDGLMKLLSAARPNVFPGFENDVGGPAARHEPSAANNRKCSSS